MWGRFAVGLLLAALGLVTPVHAWAAGPPAVNLSLSVRADAPSGEFTPGAPLTYLLRIDNSGPGPVGPLTVDDTLPPEIAVDAVVTPVGNGSVGPEGRQVTVTGLIIPANASVTVEILATIRDVDAQLALGHAFSDLNGLTVAHQAGASDPADPLGTPALSDDPATPAAGDPTAIALSAQLEISASRKTVVDLNGGDVAPGDTLQFTLTVENTGNVADHVRIDDPPPAGLSGCVAVSVPGGLDCDAAGLHGTLDVAPGDAVAVVFNSSVDPLAANGQAIRNVADLVSAYDARVSASPASRALRVVSLPVLSATKRAVGAPGGHVTAGDAFTFEVAVTNSGNRTATSVVISDAFAPPAGVALVPQDAGVLQGGSVVWTLDALDPGQTRTVRLAVSVDANVALPLALRNQALVTSAETPRAVSSDDPSTAAPLDATVVTVDPPPAVFRLDKTVVDENGGDVRPGDILRYDLTVYADRDTRLMPAPYVTDALPPSLALVEAPGSELDGAVIRWTLPADWTAGQGVPLVLRARIDDGVAGGTLIANAANLENVPFAPVGSDDPSTPNLSDATRIVVAGRPAAGVPTKSVVDENGGQVEPGDRLRYTFVVRNAGDAPAAAPQVVDDLPEGLTFVSADLQPAVAGRRVVWRLAALPPGERIQFDLVATVDAGVADGTTLRNQATVSLGGGADPTPTDDPALGGVRDATSVVVRLPAAVTLVASKTLVAPADGAYGPGDEVTYTLSVVNSGAAPSGRLEIVDPLDRNLTGTFAENGQVDAAGRSAAWALAPLAPGERVSRTLRATIGAAVAPGTRISNQYGLRTLGEAAFLRSDDPTTPEADDPVVFLVGEDIAPVTDARCDLRWIRPDGRPPAPTEPFSYRLACVNTGSTPIDRLVLRAPWPAGVSYVPGSTRLGPGGVQDAPGGQSPLDRGLELLGAQPLLPGNAVLITQEAAVLADTAPGTEVAYQGRLQLPSGVEVPTDDPQTPAPLDPTRFTVRSPDTGAPDLTGFVKRYRVVDGEVPAGARVGQTVEWTLEVVNRGARPATRLAIIDPLPERTRYVPGTLVADGAPRSDPADADGADASGGVMTFTRDALAPGERWLVSFRSVALAGPFVTNQGRLTSNETRPEASDADANEADGNEPTVVPVVDEPPPPARLAVEKSAEVDDAAGVVTYTLAVSNLGTSPAADVVVQDALPAGLGLSGSPRVPEGAVPSYEATTGRLTVEGLTLAAGGRATISFAAAIEPALPTGTRLCNTFSASWLGGTPVESAPACFEVRRPPAALAGTVYQDVDGRPGFATGGDLALGDLRVRAVSAEGVPTEVRADAGGAYRIEDLVAGTYTLDVISSTGTTFLRLTDVVLEPGQQRRDLQIRPSGRVYETRSGALRDGIRLFLYRDRDAGNTDVFDAASRARRELVPAAELGGAGEQGQVTAHGGLYRFTPLRPGRYFIDASVPETLVYPSVLRPTRAGFLPTTGPAPAATPLPQVSDDDGPAWSAAFETDAVALLENNHLPLDPLDALIDVEKRALRNEAVVGDVVTFELDIHNRSPRSLAYDPRTRSGGVFLDDRLPDVLRYVAGSAVWMQVGAQTERVTTADDPTGDLQLRFGEVRQEGGRRVLRPVTLPAGGHLRLRYQAVVGANAQPRQRYTNRATLVSAAGVPLTATATAAVLVTPDPDLDQSVIIGKVFCDLDRDGDQGPGELGLPGALVLNDAGDFAITDSAGKFHFQAVEAGTHAFKLDTDSLYPGAEMTTDETRVLSLTRGLPAKIAFGVTCPAALVDTPTLELAPEGFMKALAALEKDAVVVTGNVRALRVHVAGADVQAGAPEVRLMVLGAVQVAPDLAPGASGAAAELAFDIRVPEGAPRDRWALLVGPLGGAEEVVAEGRGPPPDLLPWDQRGESGEPLLQRGKVYAYRLEVSDAEGRMWGSPAGVFGVGAHAETDPPLISAVRGELFDPQDKPLPTLERELHKLLPRLKKVSGTIRVEIHGDDALEPAAMLAATQRRADATATRLAELLGPGAPPVVGVGLGATRPLTPNLSDKQRARNRRVELRAVPPEAANPGAGPPTRTVDLRAAYVPVARAGRDEVVAEPNGEFALTAAVPEDGVVEVSLRDVDGRRATFALRRHAGAPAAVGTPMVVALAGTPPSALTLGGAPLRMPEWATRIEGPSRLEVGADGRAAPFTVSLPAPADTAEWSVVVLDADGREAVRTGGQGPPPAAPLLDAARTPWRPGDYVARLTARTSAGALVQSAPWRIRVGPGGTAPVVPAEGRLYLNGRLLRRDGPGVFGETVVREGGRVLVEWIAPDGARVAFLAAPPHTIVPGTSVVPRAGADTGPSLEREGPVAALAASPAGNEGGVTPREPVVEAPLSGAPPPPPYTRVEPATPASSPSETSDYARVEEPAAAPGSTYQKVDEASGAPGDAGRQTTYRRIDELTTNAPATGAGAATDALGLHAYTQSAAPGTPPPAPPARRPLSPEARADIDAFGRAELLRALAPQAMATGAPIDVPAHTLSVDLPPDGAALSGRTLPIRGHTDPENRVFVNGVEFAVGPEGQFGGAATFPPGLTTLEVAAVDVEGNRGVIRRTYAPADAQWFLLVLGDTSTGAAGAELDGTTPQTRVGLGDEVYLHGRAAGWVRGRVQGRDILDGAFQEYTVEAHVDTARRREFEPAFRQTIDPDRYYPVYGDSATVEHAVHTRGPLYVLVQADRNRLTVGDFQSDVKGLELMRYDRALYGAQLKVDQASGAEKQWHHEANAFVADLDAPERHAYVELRGTGGSLYYLPYEALIEGSERVYLIERDRETGIERQRRTLVRDADYTIRYAEGRILMKSPIPRETMASFGARPQAVGGRRADMLGGHPVYLAVEMDHRDPDAAGELAVGAHVRETYDGALTLGGGYLEEGQSKDAASRYRLWGAEASARYGRRTRIETEWVQSRNGLGQSLFSDDGGLTYEPFHGRSGERARGTGMLVRGGLELDDLVGDGTQDHWYNEGYWQYLAPGFYSGGTVQSQGLEKYGVLTRYTFNEHHAVRLQHDGVVADEPETQGDMTFHGYRRNTTQLGHTYTDGPLTLDTALVHTVDDEGGEEPAFVTDVLNVNAEYGLTPRWTLIGGQELVLRGDSRLHSSTSDLLATTAGARYRPIAEVAIEGTETVRWSGDNATQIGLRTDVDDRHTVYVNERFVQEDGEAGATSVVGGEERWGEDQSGRSYGEYQLEAGELGARNRAVLGLGKRTKIVKGLTIDAGYERSQVLGGAENGELSSDTVSLGCEWLDSKRVKVTGRYELRYDDNSEEVGRRDRLQFLTLNGADWLLTPDFTFLVRLNYSHTFDLAFEATEAELVEGSLGLAFRPATWDDFAALVKYTKRYEQRPTDLLVELPIRDEYDVISLVPVLELPWHFQVVEKVAMRRMATRTLNLPTVVSQTLLWINRLNFHVTHTWDVGAEYRLLATTLAQSRRHGALTEVNYIIQKKVRLGVGYNFTSFSDDEFARLDEDHGGPFFRVVANY